MNRVLVTGCAGFIGSHLSERLLEAGFQVVGIDNFDPYYDISLKKSNLSRCLQNSNFVFHELDILDYQSLLEIEEIEFVFHLAAKAGVRPSIEDPDSYFKNNFMGTKNILEWMVTSGCKRMIFASSSSVYGNTNQVPFIENQITDFPISPYAASKKASEILNYTYHSVHSLSILNLRLFTVYGPRQRPDLAIRKFVDLVSTGKTVSIFGNGDTYRDYTFIEDVVSGFLKGLDYLEKKPVIFDTFNIASGNPIGIIDLVDMIGQTLSKNPKIEYLPMQAGDVDKTFASIKKAKNDLGFESEYSLEKGLAEYVKWKV